jgi:hypothetical protein
MKHARLLEHHQNIKIMGTEGEEIEANGMENIFNKVIEKTSPFLINRDLLRYRRLSEYHTGNIRNPQTYYS